jgi:hypothetical protein
MSLIGSVRDEMHELRRKSLAQERTIDRNGEFSHWRMSDATGVSFLERGLGVLILPVFFFWCLLLVLLSLGMSMSLIGFKLLSRLFR